MHCCVRCKVNLRRAVVLRSSAHYDGCSRAVDIRRVSPCDKEYEICGWETLVEVEFSGIPFREYTSIRRQILNSEMLSARNVVEGLEDVKIHGQS